MPCYEIDGLRPVVHPEAYVHPTAVLIGDVIVAAGCYVGPACSLRGDFGRLMLETGANFQDTCVMHGFPDTDTVVEQDGHIGHGAVLHGCVVRRNAMVGMNAVVMDRAVVGDSAIVAACAFVKAGLERGGSVFLDTKRACVRWMNCSTVTAAMHVALPARARSRRP
jgi:phenylacetic acid degradation protein